MAHTVVHSAGTHGHSHSRAAMDPHIFDRVWYMDGQHVFYTSLARSRDFSNKDLIIASIRSHLENVTTSEKWVWIFDGHGVGVKHTVHFPVAVALARMIQSHFSDNLNHVYIVNPGSAVEGVITQILPMFSRESLNNMSILKGSILELYSQLQKLGWHDGCIRSIMDRLRH